MSEVAQLHLQMERQAVGVGDEKCVLTTQRIFLVDEAVEVLQQRSTALIREILFGQFVLDIGDALVVAPDEAVVLVNAGTASRQVFFDQAYLLTEAILVDEGKLHLFRAIRDVGNVAAATDSEDIFCPTIVLQSMLPTAQVTIKIRAYTHFRTRLGMVVDARRGQAVRAVRKADLAPVRMPALFRRQAGTTGQQQCRQQQDKGAHGL